MAMKNFLAGPKLKSQGQRNGFDVSYQNQFTAPFGMLLPCFFQRVNPDDKIRLSLESQTVCDGLVKPAFMRLREHIDYYFIPTTQLWMAFDNLITGQNSYFSTSVRDVNSGKVPATVPVITPSAIFETLLDANERNRTDEQGYSYIEGAKRLFDAFQYFNSTTWSIDDFRRNFQEDATTHFNLFPLLCYQKVYYDFYRNPKYEDNDVTAYNIDDFNDNTLIDTVQVVSALRLEKFFEIHYRWQKRDYFTQVQPSVLPSAADFGYTGLLPEILVNNLLNVPGLNQGSTVGNQTEVQDYNQGYNAGNSVTVGHSTNKYNVTAIRFAFAYDRLLRRMRQAGPDFDAQMLAQYGVRPFDARHGKCTYIGGYTNSLTSKDVTNMTGESIGDLAGQINSYNDNTKRELRYHAKEHGYIIGIHSTSVDNMYQSYRTSREVLLESRYDWYNPAFENLGLQPVFDIEYNNTDDQDVEQSTRGKTFYPANRNHIIGYVPRYSELKTHVDECHGLLGVFADVVGFREWNVQVNNFSRKQNGAALAKNSLQLSPDQFDAVSGITYNGTPYTDHFVVNQYHHSKKVSTMSVYEEF